MVYLPGLLLSQDNITMVPELKDAGLQTPAAGDQRTEFSNIFKQSIDQVAVVRSGIEMPENGEALPHVPLSQTTLQSKTLKGGMLLIVGGEEPTNESIEEFAQSQGVDADLLALLMADQSAGSETHPGVEQHLKRAFLALNPFPEVLPAKTISIQAKQYTVGEGSDLIDSAKDMAKKESLPGPSIHDLKLNNPILKKLLNRNSEQPAGPRTLMVSEPINLPLPLPSAKREAPQIFNSWSLPVKIEPSLLDGEPNDVILIQAKHAEPPINLVDVSGKRMSVDSQDELSVSKQEQHLDMSRRLTEAVGQRLSAQISKGVWQVELDIHPKSLGRIEIHLEMRGGELEAYFNASKAITRELLQDGMPRLKEELRQHGIETAYLGLGSGNQGKHDETPTPSQRGENGDEPDLHAKTAVLEVTLNTEKKQNLTHGLDVTI